MVKNILILENETDFGKFRQKIERGTLVIYKKNISNTKGFLKNDIQNYRKQIEEDISKKALDFLNFWSNRTLENGKSLREMLEITEPYSWWWFIDRWLHRTPYYRNSLVEIFEDIELLKLIISVEKPSKIVVEDANTLLGKVAEKICKLKEIKFDYLKKSTSFSGFIESAKPYFVEAYLKNLKFFLRHLFSKLLVRKERKGKILVVTYGDCWTTISVPEGKTKKGDRVSQQVIDYLMKKHKISGIDYDWTPTVGVKKIIEKRYFNTPFEYYYDKNTKERIKKDRKKILEGWDFLKKSDIFKNTLNYSGVDLWPFLKNRIKFAFKKRLPSFAKDFETTRSAIEKIKPKVLFMTFEANALGRAIVIAARKNRVKVVAMQHGMIKPYHPAYYHLKEDLKSYPIPDITAVYGPIDKKILTENSFYPKSKVVVTGSPRYDIFANPERFFNKEKVYKELGIEPEKKLVVWATQPIPIEYAKKLPGAIFEAVKEFKEIYLVAKLHPRDQLKNFYEEVAKEKGAEVSLIGTQMDTNELLYSCELMLTAWSTTALEAMILNKPVITINPTGKPDPVPYAKSGAAIGVYDLSKLKSAIKGALYNKNIRKKLEERRKKFVYERVYKIDGKATERVCKLIEKW